MLLPTALSFHDAAAVVVAGLYSLQTKLSGLLLSVLGPVRGAMDVLAQHAIVTITGMVIGAVVVLLGLLIAKVVSHPRAMYQPRTSHKPSVAEPRGRRTT